jgi:hypothetical protein
MLSDLDFRMDFMNQKRNGAEIHSGERPPVLLHPGSVALRQAVRRNAVSFPSQIPILLKQPRADMQWRLVLLFFLRGWSSTKIAARFKVPKHIIRESLTSWSMRALALGYIQVIDPEAFAACCHSGVERGTDRDTEEAAAAIGLSIASERMDGHFTPFQGDKSSLQHRLRAHDEEHVSHAVV